MPTDIDWAGGSFDVPRQCEETLFMPWTFTRTLFLRRGTEEEAG
jgi:hypothetical protein